MRLDGREESAFVAEGDTRAPHASDAAAPPTASTSTPSFVASATAAMESLLDLSASLHLRAF